MWYFQPSALAIADDEPQPSTMRQADIEEGVTLVESDRDDIKRGPLSSLPYSPQSPVLSKDPAFKTQPNTPSSQVTVFQASSFNSGK